MTSDFGDGGVLHGAYLGELTEVVVARDYAGVLALHDRGVELLGRTGVVRAIGVAAGFDGINRVADAIGIPLDERFESLDEAFWAATRIDRFTEAR